MNMLTNKIILVTGGSTGIGDGKAKVVRWYRTVRLEGVPGVRVMSWSVVGRSRSLPSCRRPSVMGRCTVTCRFILAAIISDSSRISGFLIPRCGKFHFETPVDNSTYNLSKIVVRLERQ